MRESSKNIECILSNDSRKDNICHGEQAWMQFLKKMWTIFQICINQKANLTQLDNENLSDSQGCINHYLVRTLLHWPATHAKRSLSASCQFACNVSIKNWNNFSNKHLAFPVNVPFSQWITEFSGFWPNSSSDSQPRLPPIPLLQNCLHSTSASCSRWLGILAHCQTS